MLYGAAAIVVVLVLAALFGLRDIMRYRRIRKM